MESKNCDAPVIDTEVCWQFATPDVFLDGRRNIVSCLLIPQKVHPHMFRRTRATDLYQSTVDLELVSRILGHSSTQTTRIYARPSLEMIRTAMDNSTTTVEVEEAMWPDNEDELARLFGLR